MTDEDFSEYSRQRIDAAKQRMLDDGTINVSELIRDPPPRRTFPSRPKCGS